MRVRQSHGWITGLAGCAAACATFGLTGFDSIGSDGTGAGQAISTTHAPSVTSSATKSRAPTSSPTSPAPTQPAPLLSLGSHSAAVLQLQVMLARLHYLPLGWRPAQPLLTDWAAQLQAVSQPPAGTWYWRYAHIPLTLRQLWTPGTYTVLTQGAVMAFQHVHGLAVDGIAGPQVWSALVMDSRRQRIDPLGYSYMYVSESFPETLTLWRAGKTVLTSRANTGIPQSPTARGTWPVYLRFTSQTMSGHTPSGAYYSDPGVPWVNYFHGSDAVHGFVRASYGTPQSLGCVELPVATAASVWNEIDYGTLVTVGT